MSVVMLKDGSQVALSIVAAISRNLYAVAKKNRVALYDLVQKCKKANYSFPPSSLNPFGDAKVLLKEYGLLDSNDGVQDTVKSVALNSIVINGFQIKLVNPILKPVENIDA